MYAKGLCAISSNINHFCAVGAVLWRSCDYHTASLKYLEELTGLVKPQFFSSERVKMALPVKKVPEAEQWRTGLMDKLMKMKKETYLAVSDSKRICAMIDSLCNT